MNTTPVDDGYVLGHSSEEYRRLRSQARMWDEATKRVLGKVGLSTGMRCLDVGCGPGSVMESMGEIVGATGRVTGIDADAAIGTEALQQLRANGPDIYGFVAADITKIDTVTDAPFDLVFSRLLLFHLADPKDAIKRLWSWVRPGGVLCVMDYDNIGSFAYTQSTAPNRALVLIKEAFAAVGKHQRIGSEMPLLFEQVLEGPADGTDYSGHIEPIARAAEVQIRPLLKSLRPVITVKLGRSAAELDALDAELSEVTKGAQGSSILPAMIATWKRKV